MPMLVLTGEKASGEFLIQQGRLVAEQVDGAVIKGSGHWLMEEAPTQVIPKLTEFLSGPWRSPPWLRRHASNILATSTRISAPPLDQFSSLAALASNTR